MKPLDLLCPVPELEEQLNERVRNMYPADPKIPRNRFFEEVHRILSMKELPPEYANSRLWKEAHALTWQIKALKKEPGPTLWHPV